MGFTIENLTPSTFVLLVFFVSFKPIISETSKAGGSKLSRVVPGTFVCRILFQHINSNLSLN